MTWIVTPRPLRYAYHHTRPKIHISRNKHTYTYLTWHRAPEAASPHGNRGHCQPIIRLRRGASTHGTTLIVLDSGGATPLRGWVSEWVIGVGWCKLLVLWIIGHNDRVTYKFIIEMIFKGGGAEITVAWTSDTENSIYSFDSACQSCLRGLRHSCVIRSKTKALKKPIDIYIYKCILVCICFILSLA